MRRSGIVCRNDENLKSEQYQTKEKKGAKIRHQIGIQRAPTGHQRFAIFEVKRSGWSSWTNLGRPSVSPIDHRRMYFSKTRELQGRTRTSWDKSNHLELSCRKFRELSKNRNYIFVLKKTEIARTTDYPNSN